MDSNQITYPVTFTLRRGEVTDLYSVDETPHAGEPIIEIDTLKDAVKIKIGDGKRPYSQLKYVNEKEISELTEKLEAFFANAEISDQAIDTLVEIQKILNDSSLDIQELLTKVNEFEALHKEIVDTHNHDKEIADLDRKAIRDDMAAEDQRWAQSAAAARKEIRDEVDSLKNTTTLNNASTNERIDRVEEYYRAADKEIIKSIDSLTTIHYEDKDAVVAQLEAFADNCTEIHDELRGLINSTGRAFQEADALALENLNKVIAEVRTEISTLEEKHDKDLDDLQKTNDEFTTQSTTGLAALDNKIGNVELNANMRMSEIEASIIAETSRATEAENILNNQIKEITNDYLTSENENSLKASITAVSGVANNAKSAIDAFLKDAEISESAVDTLKEIQAELNLNETGAAAMLARIQTLEAVDNATQVELDNAINAVNTEINKKADLVGMNAIDARVLSLENAGHGTVTQIENAKTEAIADAASKADAAKTEAKSYADTLKENTNQELEKIYEQMETLDGKINALPANELEVVKADLASHKEESSTNFANINTALEEVNNQINDVSNEINETINSTSNTINKKIDDISSEINGKLDNAISDRATIRVEFAEADSEIVEANTADHASIRNELGQAMSVAQSDRALIREQYAAADNALSISCEAENTSIRAEFAAKDLEITTNLNAEIARATAAEADVLSQSKAYTDSVKTAILGSEQLESTFNTLTNIAAWIEGDGVNATELTEAIAVETQNRATEDAAIRQSITDLNTAINATINELDIAHKAEIQSTNDTVAALGTELRGVDSNINARLDAAIAAHEAEDARIDAAYKAADTYWVNDIDTRYTKAVADMTADYIKRDEDIIAYFDEQLGVIMNGSY